MFEICTEKKELHLLVNTRSMYSFVQKGVTISLYRYPQYMIVWPWNFLPNTDNEIHKLVSP